MPDAAAPSLGPLTGTAGNRAVSRLLKPAEGPAATGAAGGDPAGALARRLVAQAKLSVSQPEDASERAADEVAAAVGSRSSPTGRRPSRPAAVSRLEPPGGGGLPSAGVPPAVESLITGASGGVPMPSDTRSQIEPHLGADLSDVHVHSGPAVAAAADSIHARAFTHGSDIFLGAEESPSDVSLMAHESTHVVQQGAAGVQRQTVQRLSISDIPGADYVLEAVQAIPGYRLLSVIIGEDPITGDSVANDRAEFVQVLLGYGPFAGAVGPVLAILDTLDDVFELISTRLSENNLTFARVTGDISAAWDEMDLWVLDQDPNIEIAARYIRRFIADVKAFINAIVADLLAAVRAAAVAFAEPLVQTPEIKPYWDLGVKVFHYDPLKGEQVNAPTVEILADFLRLIHQDSALAQMQERNTLQATANWLDTQFATFNDLRGQATALFADAWDAISPKNLPYLIDNIKSLASRALGLLRAVGEFAANVVGEVLSLIKDSLLGWLSERAHRLPGFHLMTVILCRNPFTGEHVERNAENLIKGFITLLPNGDQMYDQLAESGVIADAAARIETAMSELNISWDLITGTFRAIWDGMKLEDLLDPIGAFMRILNQFGEPLGRIVSFAATVVGVVIELILRLLNFPSDLLGNIIANAMAAIDDIKRDPIQFLMNIVLAMKQGVVGFLERIGTYLLEGLTDWLFRGLRGLGIEPPTDLSLEGVINLVLQVLGVTVETLWTKLGDKIGPERVAQIRAAADSAGQAWAFVKDVQERGITAIWEFISGQLGNLWDMILNKAKDWIMSEIIDKVMGKLISMLDPTGVMAVINSCIAFFNAVQSVIEYIREILQIIDQYVSTIASVARGDVAPGAAKLEQGLASAVPVAIGFLANQVGLSNVPEKVMEIIQGLRELIDQALNWLFDQAWKLGQAALNALGLGDDSAAGAVPDEPIDEPVPMDGTTHHLKNDGPGAVLALHSATILVNSIPDPALQALVSVYNSPTTTKAVKQATAKQIAQWIATHNPAAGLGGSAPGLGSLTKHGSQEPRLTNTDVPLWALRSEHVVPWAVVSQLWVALGVEGLADRATLRSLDNALTTIMIYKNAGVEKDKTEGSRLRGSAAKIRAMTAVYAQQPDADTPIADKAFRQQVITFLRGEQTWFADFTAQKVAAEHAEASGSSTHGALREEAAAVPTVGDIAGAAAQEVDDADRILEQALAESVRP